MSGEMINGNVGGKLPEIIEESTNQSTEKKKSDLVKEIEEAAKGLIYISESDANIEVFAGSFADSVTKENLLKQTQKKTDTNVNEISLADFFDNLTEMQDWFGDEEKENAEKFTVLRDLLKANLRDLKVFKLGKLDIDIFIVGLDAENNLTGIQTKAVET